MKNNWANNFVVMLLGALGIFITGLFVVIIFDLAIASIISLPKEILTTLGFFAICAFVFWIHKK